MADSKPVGAETGAGVITGIRRETVPSPCVSICALDDRDVCVGCFRSGREISDWGKYSDEQKRAVLRRCVERSSPA